MYALSLFSVVLSAAFLSSATPLEKKDVWSPRVLYPHTGDTWIAGEHHNVTWDTSNPPSSVSNKGVIYLAEDGVVYEPCCPPTPELLADNVDLYAGRVVVQVPYVPTESDYQIVLFGDSGNLGSKFTIFNSGTV